MVKYFLIRIAWDSTHSTHWTVIEAKTETDAHTRRKNLNRILWGYRFNDPRRPAYPRAELALTKTNHDLGQWAENWRQEHVGR